MRRKTLKILLIVLAVLLAAELIFVGVMHFAGNREEPILQTDPIATQPTTVPTTEAPTEAPTTVPETTEAPTEAPTTVPVETEPQPQSYILTFTGDCTLGSDPNDFGSQHSFVGTVGEDYGFPFRNVAKYFENDDFTIVNLESVLADEAERDWSKTFNFRGPTAYTQILTGSSVEAVTLANNHTMDFGAEGFRSTKNALESAGVDYVEENKTTLLTTDSGLTIGLYADAFYFSKGDIQKNISQLKADGAEIIICAFHWGKEGSYRPTGDQKAMARAAIDAGADIVYGHHPHVLQPIEVYGDGVIFYSLGNFSFGGNNFPRDLDSAIVQQEVIREVDGTLRLGELTIIPVSITSLSAQNNFQPTPYEEGTEAYQRTLSKLDGSFTGPDLVVDYSFLHPTDPTDSTQATEPPAGTEAPPATEGGSSEGDTPEAPPAGDPPANDPPADAGDTGSDGPQEPAGDTGSAGEAPPPADDGSTDG